MIVYKNIPQGIEEWMDGWMNKWEGMCLCVCGVGDAFGRVEFSIWSSGI